MDPQLLRGGFRVAVLITLVAGVLVALEPRDSAEFVVSVLTLLIGLAFLGLVALLVRYSTPRIPAEHNRPQHRAGRDE